MGRRSFTLVELMIVVAIVMVLAAIALPLVHTAQLKAKWAEVPVNVEGIRDAHLAYVLATDASVNVLPSGLAPTGVPGKKKKPWATGSVFDIIDWQPDGDVYAQYENDKSWGGGTCADANEMDVLMVTTDLDGNGAGRVINCCYATTATAALGPIKLHRNCGSTSVDLIRY